MTINPEEQAQTFENYDTDRLQMILDVKQETLDEGYDELRAKIDLGIPDEELVDLRAKIRDLSDQIRIGTNVLNSRTSEMNPSVIHETAEIIPEDSVSATEEIVDSEPVDETPETEIVVPEPVDEIPSPVEPTASPLPEDLPTSPETLRQLHIISYAERHFRGITHREAELHIRDLYEEARIEQGKADEAKRAIRREDSAPDVLKRWSEDDYQQAYDEIEQSEAINKLNHDIIRYVRDNWDDLIRGTDPRQVEDSREDQDPQSPGNLHVIDERYNPGDPNRTLRGEIKELYARLRNKMAEWKENYPRTYRAAKITGVAIAAVFVLAGVQRCSSNDDTGPGVSACSPSIADAGVIGREQFERLGSDTSPTAIAVAVSRAKAQINQEAFQCSPSDLRARHSAAETGIKVVAQEVEVRNASPNAPSATPGVTTPTTGSTPNTTANKPNTELIPSGGLQTAYCENGRVDEVNVVQDFTGRANQSVYDGDPCPAQVGPGDSVQVNPNIIVVGR